MIRQSAQKTFWNFVQIATCFFYKFLLYYTRKEKEEYHEKVKASDSLCAADGYVKQLELRSIVVDASSEGSVEEISSKAKKAMALLEYRNNKCLILK